MYLNFLFILPAQNLNGNQPHGVNICIIKQRNERTKQMENIVFKFKVFKRWLAC